MPTACLKNGLNFSTLRVTCRGGGACREEKFSPPGCPPPRPHKVFTGPGCQISRSRPSPGKEMSKRLKIFSDVFSQFQPSANLFDSLIGFSYMLGEKCGERRASLTGSSRRDSRLDDASGPRAGSLRRERRSGTKAFSLRVSAPAHRLAARFWRRSVC